MTRFALLLFVIVALILPHHAAATIVLDQSIEQLAVTATSVVHGTVVSTRSRRTNGRWTTQVLVTVIERVKSDPAEITLLPTIGFVLPGGGDGELAQIVPGTPRFTIGEEVVIFLWRGPDSTNRLLGLSQGTFRVDRKGPAAESPAIAVSDRRQLSTFRHKPGTLPDSPTPIQEGVVVELPLTELLGRVHTAVKSLESK
ncbi:MAG: hypothetical protein HUU55_11085 [Myxococcales bacterium]|nr:hypothetical protein [Myxococcales bacterium]